MKTSYVAALIGLSLSATPAPAQNRPLSEDLLEAVKQGDSGKLVQLINSNGTTMINIRGYDGSTALTLAVKAKNDQFADYLLSRGANPDQPGIGNEPPILIAARQGWDEGVDHLLIMHAKVDATNRQGETALIVAVQGRYGDIVRRLLAAGANPDKPDNSAGLTARDYAKRDNRARDILSVIERSRPAAAIKR